MTNPFCKYKDILGSTNTGIHSYRLFNVAYMDCIATIIGAALFSYLMKWSFPYVLGGLFLLGIVLHRLFCVRTTVDKILFPNDWGRDTK